MNRTRLRAIALANAVGFLSGCFSYVPTQLAAVPEGTKIRVHLTPAAQVEMTQRAGRRLDDTVDGTLARRQPNQFTLQVPVGSRQEGFFRSDIAQELQFTEPDVTGIDVRTFSRGKTALLVAGTAGGVAAIVLTIMHGSGNGTQPGDGGPEEIRVPLASIRTR